MAAASASRALLPAPEEYNQSAAAGHWPLLLPLFYYTHLSKTGGSSFVEDAPRFTGLSRCGDVHCGGDTSNAGNISLPSMGEFWERTKSCNFIACEGSLEENIKHLADGSKAAGRLLSRRPRSHLHMLREPHTHILSMYGHCQTRTDSPSASMYEPIGFEEWLALAAEQTNCPPPCKALRKYCAYNPHNFQTRRLGSSSENWLADLQAAKREVSEAGYIGLLEHYALSLCVLAKAVDGVAPDKCRCAATAWSDVPPVSAEAHRISPLPAVKHVLTPWQVGANDINHNSHPETVAVSKNATHLINTRLAVADIQLYAFALARFEHDAAAAGMGCWLKDEAGLRRALKIKLPHDAA